MTNQLSATVTITDELAAHMAADPSECNRLMPVLMSGVERVLRAKIQAKADVEAAL